MRPGHHEEILRLEAVTLVFVDDFNMGQPLPVGANLVLALNDEYSAVLQDA